MAEENGVAVPAGEGGVRRITELRVVDLKAELKKRNLDINGNKSALMERLRQVIQEEGGNPDEISFNPETPNNRTSKRVGKGYVVDDSEVEDYREGDFLNRQELEGTTEDAEMLCAAELEPMQASDVIEETKVTSEEAGVVEDIYQKEVEGNTSVSVQVEGVLALGVDNDIHWATTKMEIDCKKPVEEKVGAKKIDTKTLVTENASKMGSSQQGHEVEEASIENVEQELQLRTVESKDEIMKTEDEDSDEATKKDPLIVEGSDQNKSSVEDEKDTNNEANPEKGRSGNINTGKNLLVHGLSADTRANDLKNLFRKYGKVICAKVVTDARNPGEHYYGFITMSTVKEATECISTLNQTELSGQTITVELAKGTIKKRTEEKGGSAKDSTSHSSRKTGNDSWSSRDKSSSNGKSQEDSKKQDHDRSKRRGKDDHRHRPSRSRSRSSERRRSRERKRTSRSRSRHRRSRSRHRRSRSRHRRSRSRHRRSSSHYRRSKSRRRRSSSRYRRSSSRHRRERSIEKLIELRERERHWDRKKEMWEMERRREREAWERETRQEREARKMLERELERLQLERLRLEKERLEREALERQKFLVEGETRREQELLHKMHDKDATRPLTDLGHREAYEREIRQEREAREMLEKELERLQLERMHLEKERLERDALDRKRLLGGGEARREPERMYRESSPGASATAVPRSRHHQHNPAPLLPSSASPRSLSGTIAIPQPLLSRHLPLPTPSRPLPSLLPATSGLGTRCSTGLLATPRSLALGPRRGNSRPPNPIPPCPPPRPNATPSRGSQEYLVYL